MSSPAVHAPRVQSSGTMKLLSPTGHLGFTPIEEASFWAGVERGPDYIVADSGSCDIGPQALGVDAEASPQAWQEHDLELMLTASRRLGVPMIVGSAGDTGTDRGVRKYAGIIRSLARKHGLAPFRMATIYSQQDPGALKERLARRRVDRRPGRSVALDRGRSRRDGPRSGRHGRGADLGGSDGWSRRHHRRPCVRSGPVCGAALARGLPVGYRVLLRQAAGMRVVLRRAVRGQRKRHGIRGARRHRAGTDERLPAVHAGFGGRGTRCTSGRIRRGSTCPAATWT